VWICLGVIQHTPSTLKEDHRKAVGAQVQKPGGMLVIDHYVRDLSRFTRRSGTVVASGGASPAACRTDGLKWTDAATSTVFFTTAGRAPHARAGSLRPIVSPRYRQSSHYYQSLPL
jgi:hypothetical protein